MMRSEEEIRKAIYACENPQDCPISGAQEWQEARIPNWTGCAECVAPRVLLWVLGREDID